MKQVPILIVLLLVSITSCKKDEGTSQAPELIFQSMEPNTVVSGSLSDTVVITMKYSIEREYIWKGFDTSSSDIFLKDSRDSTVNPDYLPEIDESKLDKTKKIVTGTITYKIDAAKYLLLRPTRPNGDTLTYDIYVKDKMGRNSNTIITPPIYILP